MNLSRSPAVGEAADRGRIPSIATLALLAVTAWAVVILWVRSSAILDAMPGQATFSGAVLFAGMWLLMMTAMMVPSVTPVVLLFRTIQRGRRTSGGSAVPTAAFVAGYLLIWLLAGVLADLAYLSVRTAGDRLQGGSDAVPLIGGGILVLAGLYQGSPLKYVCLSHCRSPFHFIMHGLREGRLGALRMGASHGAYCLGCCWGIMAVLFVVGLMNLAWMAALSLLIVVEKLAPWGVAISRLMSILFILLGVFMAARPQLFPASGLQPAGGMPMAAMSRAASAGATYHSTAVAGPYLLTLTVRAKGHIMVNVANRATGMAVTGARVSLRFSGMGVPTHPVAVPARSEPKERITGHYATTIDLMPGDYVVRIAVNRSAAAVHIRLS